MKATEKVEADTPGEMCECTSQSQGTSPILNYVIFGIISVTTFIWRLVSVPINPGGFFFHVVISGIGLVGFAALAKMGRPVQTLGRCSLLPVSFILFFGSIYLSIGTLILILLPFFLGTMTIIYFVGGKRAYAALFVLFMVPATLLLPYGVWQVISFLEFKYLQMRNVDQIVFLPMWDSKETPARTHVLSEEKVMEPLIHSLSDTVPYYPNHEDIGPRWYSVRILLKSGREIVFRLGRGNDAYPGTAWLEYGSVYQNPAFARAIKKVGISPWLPPRKNKYSDTDTIMFISISLTLVFAIAIFAAVAEKARKKRSAGKS